MKFLILQDPFKKKQFIISPIIKSSNPRKVATAKDTPNIIKVYLKVSCLVGQVTLFNSTLTSFRNVTVFRGMVLKSIVFKKPRRALLIL